MLPEWLTRQGLRVDVRTPDEVPTLPAALVPYGSVVLDDIGASDLSGAQQEALQTFVGALGGGLVAVGGPHSYGVGGYAGTPLETILPVRMDVRQQTALPTVAVVLVLDTSGSMEAFGSELAKEDLAKEIASSTIDLLSEHDQIGVITFDQTYRWLVPPTEARFKDRILDEVARISAGGGTLMYPPLVGAERFLVKSPAKVRHVIVMSDGLTDPGDFHTLVSQMAREKLTVSTVAIGSDADLTFMRNVARWGNGRSYVAKDFYDIPEIFTTEALLADPVLRRRGTHAARARRPGADARRRRDAAADRGLRRGGGQADRGRRAPGAAARPGARDVAVRARARRRVHLRRRCPVDVGVGRMARRRAILVPGGAVDAARRGGRAVPVARARPARHGRQAGPGRASPRRQLVGRADGRRGSPGAGRLRGARWRSHRPRPDATRRRGRRRCRAPTP